LGANNVLFHHGTDTTRIFHFITNVWHNLSMTVFILGETWSKYCMRRLLIAALEPGCRGHQRIMTIQKFLSRKSPRDWRAKN